MKTLKPARTVGCCAAGLILLTLAPVGGVASAAGQYDVRGVKLLMTADEALTAMRSRNLDTTSLKITKKPCVGAHETALAQGRKPDAADDCILQLQHSEPGLQITDYLVEDYPAHPGVTRVFAIEYYQFNFHSQADSDNFRRRAFVKYGGPDISVSQQPGSGVYYWCSTAASQQHCMRKLVKFDITYPAFPTVTVTPGTTVDFDGSPLPIFVADPSVDYPIMELLLSNLGAKLSIADLSYAQARTAAASHAFESTRTGAEPQL